MNHKKNRESGFIKLIILFVVFCVIVWYFKLDVRGFIDSHPQIKDALTDFIAFLKRVWKDYLFGAGAYAWNNIILGVVWKDLAPFVSGKG